MIADRNALLTAKVKLPREIVPVPELGCEIIVQGMTAGSMFDYANKSYEGFEASTQMLVRMIVNENGGRIFNDDEATIIEEWPASVIQKLTQAAARVNGAEPEGNLEETEPGAFSIASRSSSGEPSQNLNSNSLLKN